MRDKSHGEQVERWARFVKNNSDWKKHLKKFLDAQIIMARRAYKKLKPEYVERLRNINVEGKFVSFRSIGVE